MSRDQEIGTNGDENQPPQEWLEVDGECIIMVTDVDILAAALNVQHLHLNNVNRRVEEQSRSHRSTNEQIEKLMERVEALDNEVQEYKKKVIGLSTQLEQCKKRSNNESHEFKKDPEIIN